jgi:hypothetical protein
MTQPDHNHPSTALVPVSRDEVLALRGEIVSLRRELDATRALVRSGNSQSRRLSQEEWTQIQDMAKKFHESGLFKVNFKTEAQVTLALVKAFELDLPGVSAMEQLRVIYDRLEPSARLMEALATQRVEGAWIQWVQLGEQGVAECVAHRRGRPPIRMKFDTKDAERGKVDKKETYERWPADLLRSGALRKACRLQYGEVYMAFPPAVGDDTPEFLETDEGDVEIVEGRGEVVAAANGSTAAPAQQPKRTRGPAKTKAAAPDAAPTGGQAVPAADAPPAAAPAPATTTTAPAAAPPATTTAPASTAAAPPAAPPGQPIDHPLPFKTAPYAGKKLSDLTELDFRTLINGYRDAIERNSKPDADPAKAAKLPEQKGWVAHLEAWADFRGIRVPALQKPPEQKPGG